MTASDVRILVSLGAQKAGTSFLATYLRDHPQCSVAPVKEVHFFDRQLDHPDLDVAELLRSRVERFETKRKSARFYERAKKKQNQEKIDFLHRHLELVETGATGTTDYEKLLLSCAAPKDKLIGDITPANGMLSGEKLAEIAKLETSPIFVLVLRDPLDRLWSMIRMLAERAQRAGGSFDDDVEARIVEFLTLNARETPPRSNYARMIENAQKAVPSDRLHIALFEEFMTAEGIAAFCDFAGIDHHPVDTSRKVHVGKKASLAEEQKIRLLKALQPQYEATEAHFGRLPERWRKQLELVS